MFRSLINQPTPAYWCICDDPSCGVHVQADMPSSKTVQEAMQAEAHFVGLLLKDGWLIKLQMQLCPTHTAMLRESARNAQMLRKHGLGNGQARIVEPSPAEQRLVDITRVKPS